MVQNWRTRFPNKFSYSYIYYFLVAKYMAENIHCNTVNLDPRDSKIASNVNKLSNRYKR